MSDFAAEPQEGEGAERPDFLLEKFQTVEAQAAAYAEAEKRMRQIEVEAQRKEQEYIEAIQTVAQQLQVQQQPEVPLNQNPIVSDWQRALDEGDAESQFKILAYLMDQNNRQLVQQMQQQNQRPGFEQELIAETAGRTLAQEYGDTWEQIAPQASEIIDGWKRAGRLPAQMGVSDTVQAMRDAADIVRARAGLVASPQQVFDAGSHAKLQAQSASGGTARGQSPQAPTDADFWAQVQGAGSNSYSGLINRAGR